MLKSLALENVGPASRMALELAPRMNLLTGDNGLGKSFLLDVAWWTMTRRWPQEINGSMTSGFPAQPRKRKRAAAIRFKGLGKTRPVRSEWRYSRKNEAWLGKAGRPWLPGLVVYAHADGSFSVWDPARNYWQRQDSGNIPGWCPAYVFTEAEVWDGLRGYVDGRMTPLCNGLLYDWSAWIGAKDEKNAKIMESVLRVLSPPGQNPDGVIKPGKLRRLSVSDSRYIPSINTTYAGSVPILHASSGIRRVCAIAIAAAIWGPEWSTQIIEVKCDNAAVVAVLNSGNSRDPELMHLLRCLSFLMAKFHFTVHASHVAGSKNVLADALSRNNLDQFLLLHPQANRFPTPIPQELVDLLIVTRPDWTSSLWTRLWNSIF